MWHAAGNQIKMGSPADSPTNLSYHIYIHRVNEKIPVSFDFSHLQKNGDGILWSIPSCIFVFSMVFFNHKEVIPMYR